MVIVQGRKCCFGEQRVSTNSQSIEWLLVPRSGFFLQASFKKDSNAWGFPCEGGGV